VDVSQAGEEESVIITVACHLKPSIRDLLVRLFREEVYRRTNFIEFPPQADFRLASEGWTLTNEVVEAPTEEPRPFDPDSIKPEDFIIRPKPVKLLVACHPLDKDAMRVGETDNYAKIQWQLAVPRVHTFTMPDGTQETRAGIIAHKDTMLASFKNGKSKCIGMWATGFAPLPGATIDMVGFEYSTSEHEFNYLTEALLSGDKPLIKSYKHFYNDVRQGRMYLELNNGMSYGVRSWKNKDQLRGGQITGYLFNEIYQLPGLEVYTGNAQNLRVERGFSTFTSTPDRPWVKVLHKMGHGNNPDWHCVCDNNAAVNPFSFDLTGLMADLPDWETLAQFAPGLLLICRNSGLQPGALMSREKFLISWLGRMGGFVGRVYNFDKAALTCWPNTHPHLFKPSIVRDWNEQANEVEDLQLTSALN
jgi:hypothetical protein